MKRLFFTLVVAALFAVPAFAQDKDKHANEWDNKVKTELKLTEDQITKYDALSKEFKGKADALAQDASLTKEAHKQKKMEMKNEKETKFAEFLTAEQLTRYRELVSEKKRKMEKDKSQKS